MITIALDMMSRVYGGKGLVVIRELIAGDLTENARLTNSSLYPPVVCKLRTVPSACMDVHR